MARFSLKWLFVGVAFIGLGISGFIAASQFFVWASGVSVFFVFAISSTYAAVKRLGAPFALGVALTCFARANSELYWIPETLENLIVDERYELTLEGETRSEYQLLIRRRSEILNSFTTLSVAAVVGVFGQWVASNKTEGLAK